MTALELMKKSGGFGEQDIADLRSSSVDELKSLLIDIDNAAGFINSGTDIIEPSDAGFSSQEDMQDFLAYGRPIVVQIMMEKGIPQEQLAPGYYNEEWVKSLGLDKKKSFFSGIVADVKARPVPAIITASLLGLTIWGIYKYDLTLGKIFNIKQ